MVWVLENRNKDFEERKGMSMSEIVKVAEIFGKNVFNEAVMKERLPKSVFKMGQSWIRLLQMWWLMP